MIPKIIGAQRDFSGGEIDVTLKRADDHPARKFGLRQMSNMRILNSRAIQNRSGRRALFRTNGKARSETVTMAAGSTFRIVFTAGLVQLFASSGALVASFTEQGNTAFLPWTADQLDQIVYAPLQKSIYITFAGMRPQVLAWDGAATWAISDFQEAVEGGSKRTSFYRISPQGITLLPSAQTGNVTVTASAPLWTAAHVGTRITYVNRQILITGYTSPLIASGTVQEALPGSQELVFPSDPSLVFSVGDIVLGNVNGAKAVVTSIVNATNIKIQLLTTTTTTLVSQATGPATFAFTNGETIVGPGGGLKITTATAIQQPQAVTVWEDEVMNDMRGYPASCFTDQYRLGFCDFPQLPGGIAWSAINSPTDLYSLGVQPDNAIFEIVPDKVRVLYVVPGAESSEFVFCDQKLYYIPINVQSPLKPGSVSFQILSNDGCARVQPRSSGEIITYVNAGANSVMAILALGAYSRPFNTVNLTELHSHLFDEIVALALPTADSTYPERYAYALNASGALVVGKYTVAQGQVSGAIGWGPQSGEGIVDWVSAWNADVLFSTSYFGRALTICELLDDTYYLDCAILVNSPPAALAAPFGKGPLWFAAGQRVALMDQSTRFMGAYDVDALGNIVPQNTEGEDLTAATLVAGQLWTSIVEPFAPDANSGADVHQRMLKRRIARFIVYVVESTGYTLARLFSGPSTPTSPALGTPMAARRFSTWRAGDVVTLPPPMREEAQSIRPVGRAHDPRVALIKDTPGPMQISEIGIEVSL
jgi:hypothetical protein